MRTSSSTATTGSSRSGCVPVVLCISRGNRAGGRRRLQQRRQLGALGQRRRTAHRAGHRPIGNHALGSNNGVHYLVGVPTASMPTSGSAYYSIAGATSPTFASGAVAPGTFTGQGLVQFASGPGHPGRLQGRHGLRLRRALPPVQQRRPDRRAGRLVEIGNTQIRMTGRNTFSGNIGVVSQGSADRLGCGGSNCRANVEGGFFGAAGRPHGRRLHGRAQQRRRRYNQRRGSPEPPVGAGHPAAWCVADRADLCPRCNRGNSPPSLTNSLNGLRWHVPLPPISLRLNSTTIASPTFAAQSTKTCA